jgi:hypothetical protein
MQIAFAHENRLDMTNSAHAQSHGDIVHLRDQAGMPQRCGIMLWPHYTALNHQQVHVED